jgi:hypothetical protein
VTWTAPRRLSVLALAALLGLGASHPATAGAAGTRLRGRLVDVRILVDGTPTPFYTRAANDDRHYFAAVRSERYAIELRNRTTRRVGVPSPSMV